MRGVPKTGEICELGVVEQVSDIFTPPRAQMWANLLLGRLKLPPPDVLLIEAETPETPAHPTPAVRVCVAHMCAHRPESLLKRQLAAPLGVLGR